MGACLSKKEPEPQHRHVGVSGMHNHNHNLNHKNREPYVNQSKVPFQQPYQLPNKQAPRPRPTVKRPDTSTILGKQFDVKRPDDTNTILGKQFDVKKSDTNAILGKQFDVKKPDINTILGKQFEDVRKIYTLGEELGRGNSGVTYLCTEKSTGLKYACKSISKSKFISKAEKEEIKREIQIMQHMSGKPNIVEFKGAYEDKNSVHVVMELCAGGQLFDRITAKGRYSERDAASICRQIVNIVHICHFKGVMHRDLKPENLLLSSEDDKATIMATDFGLSVFIEEGKVYTDIVGSPYYVAPEVLRQKYGKEIDIWSAGIILYILLCGVPPFWAETQKEIFDAILKGHIDFESPPWPIISNSAKDLVRKMLTHDPKQRITASQVLGNCGESFFRRDSRFEGNVYKHGQTWTKVVPSHMRFKVCLQRLGSKLTEAEVRQLMEAADVEGNGTVDYIEFNTATMHRHWLERDEQSVALSRCLIFYCNIPSSAVK